MVEIAISKNNIPIRLTSERWHKLVSIEDPDSIYEGNNGAMIAVKKFEQMLPKFIVTVYKEIDEHDGFIITAYMSVKKQEFKKKRILWKR